MSTKTSKIFADRLSDLIEEKRQEDIDYRQISDKTEIPTGSLSNYANDKQQPNITRLAAIAKYFGVSTDWLLGLSDVRTPDIKTQAICNYTGLSEHAVFELFTKNSMGLGTGLSIILETPNAAFLLHALERYYYDLVAAYILEAAPEKNDDVQHAEISKAIRTRVQIHNTLQNVISNSGIEFLSVSDMYAAKVTHLLTNTLNALELKAQEDSKTYLSSKT